MASPLGFDEIGYWSEIKLDILKDYAKAYSTILAAQRKPSLYHVYIDAFAGAGMHRSRSSQEFVPGSPLNALSVKPSFCEYHFIEIDTERARTLRDFVRDRRNVHVYEGDCNHVLLNQVFPKVQYSQYRRGLCVLDPYGLHLIWRSCKSLGV